MSTTSTTTANTTTANTAVPATPAVRALADRLGVTLATVVGTGAGGRIRTDDVRAAANHGWFPGHASTQQHSDTTATHPSSTRRPTSTHGSPASPSPDRETVPDVGPR